MSAGVSDSEFYMWRALFALVHADDVVTHEEIRFMAETFEDVEFSDEQRRIMEEDVKTPQDAEEMFEKITEQAHQVVFFDHARKLIIADGNYAQEEQNVMVRLYKKHIEAVDVDALIGKVNMQLEKDD